MIDQLETAGGSKLLPSAWHCFLFMPKSTLVLPN